MVHPALAVALLGLFGFLIVLLALAVVGRQARPFRAQVVGWPTGVEPVTFGATVRCSAG